LCDSICPIVKGLAFKFKNFKAGFKLNSIKTISHNLHSSKVIKSFWQTSCCYDHLNN